MHLIKQKEYVHAQKTYHIVCVGAEELGKVITKKPITASEVEQEENSRSKSAKLRIFERM